MNSDDKNQRLIQSVNRASDIMKCFYDARELRLSEISRRTCLNPATCAGIVSTLVYCGFLQQDENSQKYSLGIDAFRLGQRYKPDAVGLIRPFLQKLSSEFQETANYIIRDDLNVIYIEKVESPLSMRIRTFRGQCCPMYNNGAGKAIWAYLPEAEQSSLLERTDFIKVTENTISSKEDMIRELTRIREQGYSVDDEESEYGLYCIAVPILDIGGDPIGAVSLSGPKTRMTNEKKGIIISGLKDTAESISMGLTGLK